ncbi:MAG: GrpB family protein, partial [Bacilli bacterium]
MKISEYQPLWETQFNFIAKYLKKTLTNCNIIHVGMTSISGMAACPIIDIAIVIPTINELPLMNDYLLLMDYFFIGNTKTIGEYVFQNKQFDLPNHNISVMIEGEEAHFNYLAFCRCCKEDPTIISTYNTHIIRTYPDEVPLMEYYEETRLFIQKQLKKRGIIFFKYQIMWPDFENCLLNVTSSIQKHFKAIPTTTTLSCVDDALEGKDHVLLILLDGMGIDIMEKNLPEDAFLWKHLSKQITTIYPPTTVAATTMVQTGLLPADTGWIGWNQYFKDIDRHVIMFRNEDYFTDEVIPSFDTKLTLPTEPMYHQFKDASCEVLWPSFKENGFQTFHDMIDQAISITHKDEKTYTYLYWNEPDASLHEFGCQNPTIKTLLSSLSDEVKRLYESSGSKTTIMVVADHGLIDIAPIYINRFKDITSLLKTRPSLEGRTSVFYVKDKHTFPQVFQRYFANYFDLYDCESFMKTGLLGKNPKRCKPFLGDFVALAKD